MEYSLNLDDKKRFYNFIRKIKFLYPNKNKLTHSLEQLLYFFKIKLLDLMIINDITSYVNVKYRVPMVLIMGILFANLREGNISINLDSSKNKIFYRIPNELHYYALNLFETFIEYLEAGYYNDIIAYQKNNYKKLKPIVIDNSTQCRLLYFQKYHFHESIIKHQIDSFLNQPTENISSSIFKQKINSIIDEIYSDPLTIRNYKKPIEKDLFQIAAIKHAFFYNFSVISGRPGTGKTSLLTNIIRVFLRTGTNLSSILLGAPTGRSASRISEAIHSNVLTIENPTSIDMEIMNLHGSTVHKILKYDKNKGNFIYGRTHKLPISVLILDEASMIDVILMSQILISLNTSSTKLILLGDKNQLPPVNAGPIFNDIIARNKIWGNITIKVTVLKNIYRSTDNLIKLSEKINIREKIHIEYLKFKNALNMPSGEWAFVSSNDTLKENIKLWIQKYYEKNNFFKKIMQLKELMHTSSIYKENSNFYNLLRSIFKITKKAIILTFVKNGNTGSNEINKYIAECITKITTLSAHTTNKKIFDGAILMITHNDYTRSLFNGDTGIIVSSQFENEYYAFFSKGEKYLMFPVSSLSNWDLAFAITIHKSQGSEFKDILMILPDSIKYKILTKEALYTGVTRAANKIIIYGNKKIFDYAKNRLMSK